MNIDEVEAARTTFAEFEQDMTGSGAKNALREGLAYALDVIENPHSDAKHKRVAHNLINSYRRKLIERITAVIDDPGSFGDDVYFHWASLIDVFERADCDEDKTLSQLKVKLLVKAFKTLSRDERSNFVRHLERDTAA